LTPNYYMAAGGAWGALAGMLLVLVLTAAGVIDLRSWEWFLVVVIGCMVAGASGGIMMEMFLKRGR